MLSYLAEIIVTITAKSKTNTVIFWGNTVGNQEIQ